MPNIYRVQVTYRKTLENLCYRVVTRPNGHDLCSVQDKFQMYRTIDLCLSYCLPYNVFDTRNRPLLRLFGDLPAGIARDYVGPRK